VNVRRIEHLGLACRSAEEAARFYGEILGLPIVSRETLPAMKLRVVKVRAGESTLELLEPLEGEAVISKFLAARGEGIHHVCFEVDDVRAASEELRGKGYRALWEEPQPGAGGRRVNFLRPRETFGVLIELSEPAREA
jgi:methylmalonyl-CoA epimerase